MLSPNSVEEVSGIYTPPDCGQCRETRLVRGWCAARLVTTTDPLIARILTGRVDAPIWPCR